MIVDSDFVAGLNTIDFYVEGNGVSDGFALKTVSLTTAVPEPSTVATLLAGLAMLALANRRRQHKSR